MENDINVLFIGDVVGRLGRAIVKELLPSLKAEFKVDLTIVNGENAAAGFGITEKVYNELVSLGIDIITMGNHMFDKKDCVSSVGVCPRIVRPANYPPGTPGKEYAVVEVKGKKVGVINLLGRVFIGAFDCPFRAADALIEKLKKETGTIIVDMHAETTSEKTAMGYYLDGRVTAVLGTHTHVMTADERMLPAGTAYISDVGMTGAYDSVIGMGGDQIIARFLTGIPQRFEPVTKGKGLLNAVLLKIDARTGKAKEIKRIYKITEEIIEAQSPAPGQK
jgi:metallophosphoesterase (TIGR00282 family)